MSHHTHIPEKIMDEAAMWLARTEEGTHGADLQAALDNWLEADPRHAEAFRRMTRFWQSRDIEQVVAGTSPCRKPLWQRPLAWAIPVAAAIGLLLLLPFTSTAPAYEAAYATEVAVTDTVSLPDGSSVAMNAASRLAVTLTDGTRQAQLSEGEAFFDIARDEDRPFVVMTGNARIRVLGTSFNVNRLADRSVVSVYTGRVEVSLPEGRGEKVVILPGQSVAVKADGISRLPDFDAASDITWRQDWLDARDIPLSEILEHINRYAAAPVRLGSSDLATLTVAGRFRLSHPEETLSMLAVIYDLELSDRGDYRLLTRAS